MSACLFCARVSINGVSIIHSNHMTNFSSYTHADATRPHHHHHRRRRNTRKHLESAKLKFDVGGRRLLLYTHKHAERAIRTFCAEKPIYGEHQVYVTSGVFASPFAASDTYINMGRTDDRNRQAHRRRKVRCTTLSARQHILPDSHEFCEWNRSLAKQQVAELFRFD